MKFARLSVFVAVFALVFQALAFSSSAAQPVRVAVSGPYPPFAEIDESGKVYGFDVDIAEAVCKELDLNCEVINLDFDDLIPAIREGRILFAVAGMGASPERLELVDFTERYYRSVSIFIERKGTFTDLTPEDIKGKRVGAQTGTLQADYLKNTYGDSITLLTAPSYDEIFDKLKKGEVDVVLSDGLPGYSYMTSPEGEELETIGIPVETGSVVDFACIALAKGSDKLRADINEAIQSLRRSGEYDRINRKYFDFIIY